MPSTVLYILCSIFSFSFSNKPKDGHLYPHITNKKQSQQVSKLAELTQIGKQVSGQLQILSFSHYSHDTPEVHHAFCLLSFCLSSVFFRFTGTLSIELILQIL